MSDKVIIHALWVSGGMYAVAIIALALITLHRPPEPTENVTGKLIALFGPMITLITVVFLRSKNGPQQPPSQQPPR